MPLNSNSKWVSAQVLGNFTFYSERTFETRISATMKLKAEQDSRIVTVNPRRVQFNSPLGKSSIAALRLENISDKPVGFFCCSFSPKRYSETIEISYSIIPNSGILRPKEGVHVTIKLEEMVLSVPLFFEGAVDSEESVLLDVFSFDSLPKNFANNMNTAEGLMLGAGRKNVLERKEINVEDSWETASMGSGVLNYNQIRNRVSSLNTWTKTAWRNHCYTIISTNPWRSGPKSRLVVTRYIHMLRLLDQKCFNSILVCQRV